MGSRLKHKKMGWGQPMKASSRKVQSVDPKARGSRFLYTFGVLPCVIFSLTACAAIRGEPESSIDPNRNASADVINSTLNLTLDKKSIKGYINNGISLDKRNEILFAGVAEIDILYFQYERDITKELRRSNFVLALLGVGVGAAGTLASNGASQILSAISTGLVGAQEAINSEVLVDRTIQALQSQMRASRDLVRTQIIAKINADTKTYPLQAVVSDLERYRQAGTITSALIGIADSAATEERDARKKLSDKEEEVFSVKFDPVGESKAISSYLLEDGISDDERKRRFTRVQTVFETVKATTESTCDEPIESLQYKRPASKACVDLQENMAAALRATGDIK